MERDPDCRGKERQEMENEYRPKKKKKKVSAL